MNSEHLTFATLVKRVSHCGMFSFLSAFMFKSLLLTMSLMNKSDVTCYYSFTT